MIDPPQSFQARWRDRIPNWPTGLPEIYNLWSQAGWLTDAVDDLQTVVGQLEYTFVVAIATNGIALAAAMADRQGKPLVVIRKGGTIGHRRDVVREAFTGWRKEPQSLEIDAESAGTGRRYLLVDDLAQTGASLTAATHLLLRTNNTVAGCALFCNLTGHIAIEGIPVFSVVTAEGLKQT